MAPVPSRHPAADGLEVEVPVAGGEAAAAEEEEPFEGEEAAAEQDQELPASLGASAACWRCFRVL